MDHLHLVITGRVQGVGFRHFVRTHAVRLDLAGRVWNRRDGAVEAEAEGDRDHLEQWLAQLRDGPPGARVAEVETRFSFGAPRYRGFTIDAGM